VSNKLVSPYQQAVAKDPQAEDRLRGLLPEYEEYHAQKVKLAQARSKLVEVMDQLANQLEGAEEAVIGC